MKTDDFAYDLPPELIAQHPAARRDASRLLVLRRDTGTVSHHGFAELADFLENGDLLVFNDTRVIPARVRVENERGTPGELLFTRRRDACLWEALVKPGKRFREGMVCVCPAVAGCRLRVAEVLPDGSRLITLDDNTLPLSLDDVIDKAGRPPLPPYIAREATDEDRERYQTVYAREPGAVAAPTAGLHFTQPLLESMASKGVESAFVTLHVGLGTFRPVKDDDPRDHQIHTEQFELSAETVDAIRRCRARHGRVIAVGTTSVRVLEYCADESGALSPQRGECDLYILPGYAFRAVDALITNFHLPRSTLLMLVSALADRETILAAYHEAVQERYRFFSYGDAMFIA